MKSDTLNGTYETELYMTSLTVKVQLKHLIMM